MYYEKLEPSTQISQNIPPPPIPINKQWFPYSKLGAFKELCCGNLSNTINTMHY